MRKARVFISCGQKTDRERNIGKCVEDYFKDDRKFETYYAERVHSSDALTDNIFKALKNSEYFVFIDFKRENLTGNECRGSLFVNQEIAIATFLKLPGIGFREKGVKREGVLGDRIYNPFPFEDGIEIIPKLKMETSNWDRHSTNELYLSYNSENVSRGIVLESDPKKPKTDWWHIEVMNRNKSKHAFSCLAYLTKIENLDSPEIIEYSPIELIWSSLGDYSVNIMANGKREIDAFFIEQGEKLIKFNNRILTTNISRFNLPKLSNGNYLLEYSVVSSNFDIASKEFLLKHQGSHKEIEFVPRHPP